MESAEQSTEISDWEKGDIRVFLEKCELLQFKECFRRGVSKTCHITDVNSEDLQRLGMF